MAPRKFIIERDIPAVESLEREQLLTAARKSNEVLRLLGPGTQWLEGHFANAKMFCAYLTKDESTNLSIVINSPRSTQIFCPLSTNTVPLADGSYIYTISVTPSGWPGALILTGADPGSFALQGTNLVVGSTGLGAGTHPVMITATP